jgi:hypothetical protein
MWQATSVIFIVFAPSCAAAPPDIVEAGGLAARQKAQVRDCRRIDSSQIIYYKEGASGRMVAARCGLNGGRRRS